MIDTLMQNAGCVRRLTNQLPTLSVDVSPKRSTNKGMIVLLRHSIGIFSDVSNQIVFAKTKKMLSLKRR